MEKILSSEIQRPPPLRTAVTTINKYIKIHWLFIALFTYTGASKLLDIGTFQFAMWKSDLLENYFKVLSYTVPIAELTTSFLLLFPYLTIGKLKIPARLIGLYASLFLMLIFTGYIGYSLVFLKNLSCTCGGIISAMSWKQHLIFNVLFSCLALRAILLHRNAPENNTRL
jgi:hypothetical protein